MGWDQDMAQVREVMRSGSIGEAILRRADLTPDDVAVREKQFGIYEEITWGEHGRAVRQLASALIDQGLQPGDTVAIMGEPTYRWLLADAAVIASGGISFGIYSTCSPEEIQHQVETARPRVFFSENQEYVDKLLALPEATSSSIEKIVVDDNRALFSYTDPRIVTYEDLMAGQPGPETLSELDRRISKADPNDTALLVFTSGTTGTSKAAMISHRNFLVGGAIALYEMFPWLVTEGEIRMIAHLPMAHAFERIVSLYSPIGSSMVVHFGESTELLAQTLYEVQPHFFHAVPRIYQKLAAQVLTRVDRSTWLKRTWFRASMRLGRRYAESLWHSGKVKRSQRAAYQLARWTAFKPILRKLGLHKTTMAITGGTHIPTSVQEMWQIWGLNLLNALGMTEAGFVAFQTERFPKPGPVGKLVPSMNLRIADDGELFYKGAGVFTGYLNLPEESDKALSDGWLASGDIGELTSEGHLILRDRKKDIMVTAGGKNISPSLIENLMKGSPYIFEFVLIADNRKFPTGLVEIDYETVADWARTRGLVFTSYTGLTQLPEVIDLIGSEIESQNAKLARVERVKKFRIIPKELDPEEGDTTPTRKVRRGQFHSMFSHLIEEMYSDEEAEMSLFNR